MLERTQVQRSTVIVVTAALAVGLTLAAAGAAAAGATDAPTATETHDESAYASSALLQAATDYDARISSGENFWRGQELLFNGTAVVENEIDEDVSGATPSERTFELRRVENGRFTGLVTQFVVSREGHATLNVTETDGQFAIVYQGDVVAVTDGVGRVTGPIGSDAIPQAKWDVSEQELDITFADGRVRPGSREAVTVESNRGAYFLRVSSSSLDADALAALFGNHVVDRNSREEYVVIRGAQKQTFDVRAASAVPTGTHELQFRVNDSVAGTTATLEVTGSARTTTRPPTDVPTTDRPTTMMPTTEMPTTEMPTTDPPTTAPGTTTAVNTTTNPVTYGSVGTAAGGPGFGVVVALLALLGTALLARRR